MCYSILFYSLREPEPSLLYSPPTYLPRSSFLIPLSTLQRNQSSSLFPSPNPSPFFPFSPPGWPFQGGRGKLKTELKRERENSQVPLSTLPTLPLTLQTRALHVGPPLVRNRHSSEGSAMPQDKMAARANRKRKASSEHWLFHFLLALDGLLPFPHNRGTFDHLSLFGRSHAEA